MHYLPNPHETDIPGISDGISRNGVTFALRYYPEHRDELPDESLWAEWPGSDKALVTYN